MNDDFDPEKIASECGDRLDQMINEIVVIAHNQGASELGPVDLIRMRTTFEKQVSPFMLPFLAATAVIRLVNGALADVSEE